MNNNKLNRTIPEESNVYRKANCVLHPTPPGSYPLLCSFFYKHAIPPGLETEIQNNLKGLRYG
jgi:hypothetical protein